jgi:hypothetical protein
MIDPRIRLDLASVKEFSHPETHAPAYPYRQCDFARNAVAMELKFQAVAGRLRRQSNLNEQMLRGEVRLF